VAMTPESALAVDDVRVAIGATRVRARGHLAPVVASGGRLLAASARLVSPDGRASARVDVSLDRTPTYRAAARGHVTHLDAFVPQAPGSGMFRVTARGRGMPGAASPANLRARIDRALMQGLAIEQADVAARVEGTQATLTSLRLRAGATTVD